MLQKLERNDEPDGEAEITHEVKQRDCHVPINRDSSALLAFMKALCLSREEMRWLIYSPPEITMTKYTGLKTVSSDACIRYRSGVSISPEVSHGSSSETSPAI